MKSVTYPKPEEIRVGKDMLLVFTGNFIVQTEFKATEQSAPGASTQTGKLRYQACNNEMCFRPASINIQVPVVLQ
jgi:Disulphide bond corrector protein DsbC